MDWVIFRVKENTAYVAPSERWPDFHSPYSTVSASRPNITVLMSAAPIPLMPRRIRAGAITPVGRKNSARPPTTVNSAALLEDRLLAEPVDELGDEGRATIEIPVLTRT